jgi:hypothetical protein
VPHFPVRFPLSFRYLSQRVTCLSITDARNVSPCCVSHVMAAPPTSSSQGKHCPASAPSRYGKDQNHWMPNPDCMRNGPTFLTEWVPCAVGHCHRRIAQYQRRPGHVSCTRKEYKYSYFETRPVSKWLAVLNCCPYVPGAPMSRITSISTSPIALHSENS